MIWAEGGPLPGKVQPFKADPNTKGTFQAEFHHAWCVPYFLPDISTVSYHLNATRLSTLFASTVKNIIDWILSANFKRFIIGWCI
ncbi:hypothetical protein ['Paenibacillus yunnanensis' Narsing Rao et al. 2020]|uniref:hypothetical protein n=1 Tax=Paenibacillus tengchongensis TaxID=2608684 RepID=UPI0016529DC8|nr:hypothetical protein [Paenibacillus tengchongensis]